jgi:hypothetical protein
MLNDVFISCPLSSKSVVIKKGGYDTEDKTVTKKRSPERG